MPLETSHEILSRARDRGYAVGAFNANNLEMVQAIVEAAELERAPVILQVSQGAIKYAGLNHTAGMVKTAAEAAGVPVVLHLDHGLDFEQEVRCLRAGFTSLMFDGSSLSFEENVSLTRKVVEMAHAVGIPVEAELGRVGGTEDDLGEDDLQALMTDPEEAVRFVELTEVDSLAVSVGTVHRMKTRAAVLDLQRLEAIRKLVSVPLVLHGASGVPDDGVRAAVQRGIAKINIATELNKAFTGAMKAAGEAKPGEVDPRRILSEARTATRETVREKIRLFGSSGKA
ncbi:MAG: class II fructose-1,6-bisphosphate aldolase [Firmicutes bacterium]|nr:class II fructose-1,6-bisphosphate aldolase [Bacillota bacterium]